MEVDRKENVGTRNISRWFVHKNMIILGVFLFVIGFAVGQYFETKDRGNVFVVNESKLLKLVSVGLAIGSKERKQEGLNHKDKELVKATMQNLSFYLSKYSKYPILIAKKNNQGYELYSGSEKVDITQELIIQLIGEKKWKAIGKEFS